jgi:hypothetical protein
VRSAVQCYQTYSHLNADRSNFSTYSEYFFNFTIDCHSHFCRVNCNLEAILKFIYEGVSRSLLPCRLERELQILQLSATVCSYIAVLWASVVSFAAITLCVTSQRVFIVVSVYFVIDSVRKLLDTPSYVSIWVSNKLYLIFCVPASLILAFRYSLTFNRRTLFILPAFGKLMFMRD